LVEAAAVVEVEVEVEAVVVVQPVVVQAALEPVVEVELVFVLVSCRTSDHTHHERLCLDPVCP